MPVFSFRVSVAEARIIGARARGDEAASVSAYLRELALGDEMAVVPMDRRKHPVSRLPYNAAAGRVVGADEIKDAMADFP